ncbi:hypothetical protein [Crossiella sp. CA198]|uniref:hypothetical protein n=1 Tax=Crossiella sp. CA198 TaxID=3455607 RepID=UPI003F8D6808
MRARLLSVAVVAAALSAGLAVPAQAAQADPLPNGGSYAALKAAKVVHTDIAEPLRTFPVTEDKVRVGSWLDKGFHSSKVYLTFDLTGMHGAELLTAHLSAIETAGDCERTRVTEAWVTDGNGEPTWLNPPRERVKLAGPNAFGPCAGDFVTWPADELVREAVHSRKSSITLALRMSGAAQLNPADSRSYERLALVVRYNRAPNAPTGLALMTGSAKRDCVAEHQFINDPKPRMVGTMSDPDPNEQLLAKFTLASTSDPAHRVEVDGDFRSTDYAHGYVPANFLRDNETYELTLRAADPFNAISPPSAPCRFSTDFTRPDQAPTVVSTDYPAGDEEPGHGGVGVTGKFTFSPNGVSDITAYHWGDGDRMRTTPANADGTLTVEYAPTQAHGQRMRVYAKDRAGNLSPVTEYRFYVKS